MIKGFGIYECLNMKMVLFKGLEGIIYINEFINILND